MRFRTLKKNGLGRSEKLKALLQSGLSPRDLALTICLAGAVGILPVLWGTSLLCVLLAGYFRLNQALMQAVNYLVYPVQLALLLPFCRLGERYFPWGPACSSALVVRALHGHLADTFSLIVWATVKAAAAWLFTVPPLCVPLYLLLLALFRKRNAGKGEPL